MNPFFTEALDLREHPIKKSIKRIKAEYISALTYIVEKTWGDASYRQTEEKKYAAERLRLYQNQLFADMPAEVITGMDGAQSLSSFSKSCRGKYRSMLVCDAALILFEDDLVSGAAEIIKEGLPEKYRTDIERVASLLLSNRDIEKKYLPAAHFIKQYRANKCFSTKKEKSIIVTANMSAGKSTLINALVGKPLARTSQEVCTGNVCYLFNKAYEDDNIHLAAQGLNFRATTDDLQEYSWDEHISIASYFASIAPDIPRLCIIDTPGVDAALYKEHSKCAHNALLNESYDIIIYIVSPTRLGTDAEQKHLQWVAQNLRKKKIIFVLNKLDEYHDFSDSVENSVHDFKDDLLKLGFENPVICPISAYFSYLIKLKMTGQALSEDEADEYTLYSKKFKRSAYDLSGYYAGVQCLPTDSEEIALSKRVGLYGLEKIIYGGI